MPELPFQGAIKLRDIKGTNNMKDTKLITEATGTIHGDNQSFPKITGLQSPKSTQLIDQHDEPSYDYKRGIYNIQEVLKKKKLVKICQKKTQQ